MKSLIFGTITFLFSALRLLIAGIHSLIPHKHTRDVIQFIIGVPFYYCTITLDRFLFPVGKRFNPFINFPRDSNEVVMRGEELFYLVRDYIHTDGRLQRDYSSVKSVPEEDFTPLGPPQLIPKHAKFVSLKRSGEADEFLKEGGKKVQCSFFDLKYTVGGVGGSQQEKTMELFVKTPSRRVITTLIDSMSCAFTPKGTEQRFYEDVFPLISPDQVNIPHVLAAFRSRTFAHTCVVSVKVDTTKWKSVTDSQGMTLGQAQAMAKVVARFHAQFWNPAKNDLRLKNFSEDLVAGGLKTLDGPVSFFLGDGTKPDIPQWMPSIWITFRKFFQNSIATMSHLDCRPGNMLFSEKPQPGGRSTHSRPTTATERLPLSKGEEKEEESSKETLEIIMLDWEAATMSPALYDYTYSLMCGLPPYQRRKYQKRLFDIHFEAQVDALKELGDKKAAEELLGDLESNKEFMAENKQFMAAAKTAEEKFGAKMKTMKDKLQLEMDLLPCVMLYYGIMITKTGNVGATQGSLQGDVLAWADRMRADVLDCLLCPLKSDFTTQDDGYETWTDSQFIDGKTKCGESYCENKATMEDLGLISSKKGNLFPRSEEGVTASHTNRSRIGEDGARLSLYDRPYDQMVLDERIMHFLQPFFDEKEEERLTSKKNGGKKRSLREDLLEMVKYVSELGMEDRMKKAGSGV